MPSANPFAPVIEVGGNATAGPASGGLNFALGGGASDNHVSAGLVLVSIGVIWLLWANKFRFSTTVG